jgi:fructose-1-phosphate kinase PfkB-like protein
VETARPTRVCTTVLDTSRHTATELVPEAGPLTGEELDAIRAAYIEEARTAALVVLIGSLPPGTPAGLYRDLLGQTPGRLILDARGPELLQALAGKPFLVKPNRAETSRTLGRELEDDQALFHAMRELNEAGAEWVVVTDGPNPVYASTRGQLYRLEPPHREVVNPIGCGDCLAAGVARALFTGQAPLEAIRFGVAVAAAKAGQLLPGLLEPSGLDTTARSVTVTRL